MLPNNPIPLPLGITFELWVSFLINTFPDQQIPLPPPVKDWWGWAELLIQNPNFETAPLPDKKLYKTEEDWVDWALLFILNIQSLQF